MRCARAFQLAIVLFSLVLLGGPVLADLPTGGTTGGVHKPPTPRPTPKPQPQPIPVPTGLTNTRDPQVCSTHAGPIAALLCAGAYTGGSLVLVFNWNGDTAYPTPGGFNIYEVDNGLHKLVDRNTTQATVGIVKRPAGGFRNRCYTVTAVVGKLQSKPSRWACLAPGSVGPFTTVVVSNPSAVRTHSHEYENYSPTVNIGPGFNCSNATPCVGGLYLYEACCPLSTTKTVTETIANYYRAYFHFKLDPDLKKQYIIKATLSDRTTKSSSPKSSMDYCLDEMAPAASDWMSEPAGSTDIVGGSFTKIDAFSLSSGLDVSSIVRSWINGSAPNNGFVLRGKLEASRYTNSLAIYCVLQLDKNAKLSIVHS
jgi:hypothetical protein